MSELYKDKFYIPFYLQIACDRSSALYCTIKTIVTICDVNTGIFERCTDLSRHGKICSDRSYKAYYPTQSSSKDFENLSYHNDIPVVVFGHENEKYYNALLREIANSSYKPKQLARRDRLTVLPVFICPVIKSSFENVIDIDLSDIEVTQEYLDLIEENKRFLSSVVLKLVEEIDVSSYELTKEFLQRKPSLPNIIGDRIEQMRTEQPNISLKTATNMSIFEFFLGEFLKSVRKLITISNDENLNCMMRSGKPYIANTDSHFVIFNKLSRDSLLEFHERYLPRPIPKGINNKIALELAKKIEKFYRELRVFIRVTPIEAKDDRFVFNVETIESTTDTEVGSKSDTVQRRLKKYECFFVDLSDKKSIKITVAEKPIEDNSLLRILKYESFMHNTLRIPFAVGYDNMGTMCISDLSDFPHLLVGGTTNSGKSTALKSLLFSIAYKQRTGDVNVIIMDFLGKEPSDYSFFNAHPFMSHPVITDPYVGMEVLCLLCEEMDKRLKGKLMPLPSVVCLIDEFPRLFSDIQQKANVAKIESAMNKLLSGGRHAKIHMVLAAQDPKRENMGCGIANIPARIALRCDHYQRSITILGVKGAESLTGKGQMLFSENGGTPKRLQGSYINDSDSKTLLKNIIDTYEQKNTYPFRISMDKLSLRQHESAYASSGEETATPHVTTFDNKLAEVIMHLLIHDEMSNSRVKEIARVSFGKANDYMKALEAYNLIPSLNNGRYARKLNPIEEVKRDEVTELLNKERNYLIKTGFGDGEISLAFTKLGCT